MRIWAVLYALRRFWGWTLLAQLCVLVIAYMVDTHRENVEYNHRPVYSLAVTIVVCFFCGTGAILAILAALSLINL